MSSTVTDAETFITGPQLAEMLARLAAEEPNRPYLIDHQSAVTTGELDRRVDVAAGRLRERGVDASSRVGVALPVGVDHVVVIFALLRLEALWVPLNPQLKGVPLRHQIDDSGASWAIVEADGALTGELPVSGEAKDLSLPESAQLLAVLPLEKSESLAPRGDASLLMYTSGTTGPPKGVLVNESMLKAAVLGAQHVTEPREGDVFYVWEPLFHIGGAQLVFLPLITEVTLALVPRFSASRFWEDIAYFGVTHLHYLGGVLQILLQLPPSELERRNQVRVAWGAGATPAVRAACAGRFEFELRECYGMTETSSIVTVNRNDPDAGVGEVLPWFEIGISARTGECEVGAETGEILVKGMVPGLLTAGYLGNREATEAARCGEWFLTGDRGYRDAHGSLHFLGRGSDSIRVKGENVSAWQIEDVFGAHPDVDRCAVVGIDAQVGEQDMVLFVTAAEGVEPDLRSILAWGAQRLAPFQVPRYAKVVDSMPLTPSQRVAKHRLSRNLDDAVARAETHRS